MNNTKLISKRKALRAWKTAFSEWHRHRTTETEVAEHAARQHYLLLAS